MDAGQTRVQYSGGRNITANSGWKLAPFCAFQNACRNARACFSRVRMIFLSFNDFTLFKGMNGVRRKALLYLRPPHADGAAGHDRLSWCGRVAAAKGAHGPPSRRCLSLGRRSPFGSRKPDVDRSAKCWGTAPCQRKPPRLVRNQCIGRGNLALTLACPQPSPSAYARLLFSPLPRDDVLVLDVD